MIEGIVSSNYYYYIMFSTIYCVEYAYTEYAHLSFFCLLQCETLCCYLYIMIRMSSSLIINTLQPQRPCSIAKVVRLLRFYSLVYNDGCVLEYGEITKDFDSAVFIRPIYL